MSRPNKSMTSSLSVNTHRHTHTYGFIHTRTRTGCEASVRPRGYEFSSLFHFHSPVSSLSRLSRSLPLASILSSLSFPALLFFIISPSLLYSVSHSSSLLFFLSLSLSYQPSLSLARSVSLSLRLAVFIFQSFISTNVRQCFCPPSIDPQREKEMGRERQRERRKGSDGERGRRRGT